MTSFKKVPTLSAESNYAQFGSWKTDLGAYLSRNDMQLWSTLDEGNMPDEYPAEIEEAETADMLTKTARGPPSEAGIVGGKRRGIEQLRAALPDARGCCDGLLREALRRGRGQACSRPGGRTA